MTRQMHAATAKRTEAEEMLGQAMTSVYCDGQYPEACTICQDRYALRDERMLMCTGGEHIVCQSCLLRSMETIEPVPGDVDHVFCVCGERPFSESTCKLPVSEAMMGLPLCKAIETKRKAIGKLQGACKRLGDRHRCDVQRALQAGSTSDVARVLHRHGCAWCGATESISWEDCNAVDVCMDCREAFPCEASCCPHCLFFSSLGHLYDADRRARVLDMLAVESTRLCGGSQPCQTLRAVGMNSSEAHTHALDCFLRRLFGHSGFFPSRPHTQLFNQMLRRVMTLVVG